MEEEVTLSNGSKEPKAVVEAVMLSLTLLWEKKQINGAWIVYDLYKLCDDPNYRASHSIKKLKKLSLVQPDGTIHSSVKNVVTSACTGDGIDMHFGSPYAD